MTQTVDILGSIANLMTIAMIVLAAYTLFNMYQQGTLDCVVYRPVVDEVKQCSQTAGHFYYYECRQAYGNISNNWTFNYSYGQIS